MNRKQAFPLNLRRIGVLAGIAILVLVVIEFNTRLQELNGLSGEAEIVRAQATQAVQTQMALQTQVAYANSDAAAEDFARGEGHLVQDGDIPVAPVGPAGSAPSATPTPSPVATPMQNWELWWWLLFGPR